MTNDELILVLDRLLHRTWTQGELTEVEREALAEVIRRMKRWTR